MKAKIIKLLIALMVLISCQKIERNNPFDPECPRELWTPTNFQAVQVENAIKLTWNVPVENISGFIISRQINHSGDFVKLGDIKKGTTQFVDTLAIGGKVHLYNLIAYAGNNESNAGEVQITPIIQATVTTATPSQIGTKTVSLGGVISTDGGSHVTDRGVCWAMTGNPTINSSKISCGNGTGSFAITVVGLLDNTLYYVRAYATNELGTSYGKEVVFTTKGYGSVTDIDGNVYKTITIGSQIWMTENLKTTRYSDGTTIAYVSNGDSWYRLTIGAFCYYSNNVSNKDAYGILYNWYSVNTGKLAPIGWHVPTDAEWSTLTEYLGGTKIAGGMLKEIGTTHWTGPNSEATNASGFSALPGGIASDWQDFSSIGNFGYWWSSTSDGSTSAKFRSLNYGNGSVSGGENGSASTPKNGFSVRCLKD